MTNMGLILGLGGAALILIIGLIVFLLWWFGVFSSPAVTTAPTNPPAGNSTTPSGTSGTTTPSGTTASTTLTPSPTTCSGPTGAYTWQGTASTYATVGIQTIPQGTTLAQCDGIKSPDGSHIAVVQSDGNVVVYNTTTGAALWATGTNGASLPVTFTYQKDGNLVLYDSTNKALWASGTNGKPSDSVAMQNDGNFVLGVFNSTPNSFPWATATNGK